MVPRGAPGLPSGMGDGLGSLTAGLLQAGAVVLSGAAGNAAWQLVQQVSEVVLRAVTAARLSRGEAALWPTR